MSSNDPGPSNSVSETRLIAAYEALSAKWIASRALLWQFPALTLTAQAFLIGAATQVRDSTSVTRILLAATIFSVGAASIAIQYKVGREAHLDLVMFDRYEAALLSDQPELIAHHSKHLDDREAVITAGLTTDQLADYLWLFRNRGRWPRPRIRVSVTWVFMQGLVSVVGAVISLLA